jgi:hypothetical protein
MKLDKTKIGRKISPMNGIKPLKLNKKLILNLKLQ